MRHDGSVLRGEACSAYPLPPTPYPQRGSLSIKLLIILVPVLFALMGFALDLGRLYLVRGELNQAANAMALAAAAQLLGTPASTENATTAAYQSLDDSNRLANKYNFGSLIIGQSTGNLSSTVNAPGFFATVADATAAVASTQADGTTARHVQVSVTADAPLLFWSLLPGGESRKSQVASQAVAGISAPLCVACGIESLAIAPLDPTDTVNFGFGDPAAGGVFTFAFSCTTTPGPTALAGPVIPYVLVNRFDPANATLDETQQAYRIGANGLIPSVNPNPTGSSVPIGCFGINDTVEQLWPAAIPASCSAILPPAAVVNTLCGFYSRIYNNNVPDVCLTGVADFGDISLPVQQDTDNTTISTDPYTTYTGNGRRIITIPIVNAIAADATATMAILGFRQFLLMPDNFTPADPNGRFSALYIGSPAPVKQGYVDDRFGLGCSAPVPSGPGKVVLHQ